MIDIDRILKSKRLSKTDVAKEMGLSRESLYRILSGNPTLDNINKLSTALDVPIAELFEQPSADVVSCPKCGASLKLIEDHGQHTNC